MLDLKQLREQNAREAGAVLEALGLAPMHAVYGKGAHEFIAPSDYNPLLRSFGCDLALQVNEGAYDGTCYVLYRTPGGEFGFMSFGWGSCSGCDALQASTSWADVEHLRKTLMDKVVWRPSREAIWLWLTDEEIQTLQWHWGSMSFNKFLEEACRELFGVEFRATGTRG